VNVGTGTATSWNPTVSGDIDAVAVSGSVVYAGGRFSVINETPRNGLAAIDVTTGQLTSWQPVNDGGGVTHLALSGSTIYLGGYFEMMGGETRHLLAAVDAVTGAATPWNPNANGESGVITPSGSIVYVGGYFDTIGGQPRSRIAAVDATTGAATAWNPNVGGTSSRVVRSILVNGSTVYVGGDFTTIGGQSRNRLAALDAGSGLATSWNPNVTGAMFPAVFSTALSGSTLYIGGQFDHVGGLTRNNLAAIDVVSAVPTTWNPDANDFTFPMLLRGSKLIVGGGFTTIGGQPRQRLAELDVGRPLRSSSMPTTRS
jgi:beta-propeller uncharacterized protein DUF5122